MISAAVRALAAGRNQSYPQIAAMTGIPYRTLHRKVIGQAPWTASEVKKMSLHFDIRIADLFSALDGKACAWRDSNPQPSDPTVDRRSGAPSVDLSAVASVIGIFDRRDRRPAA